MSAGKHAKPMKSTRTTESKNLSAEQTHIKIIQLEVHSRQAHFQSYCLMYYISEMILVLNLKDTKPADIYLLKVNNGNTRTMCEISSKLTVVNFEHVSHIVLVFPLLTLNK